MKKELAYKTLSESEKAMTETLIQQYYGLSHTLAQIFNVNSEVYKSVPLYELGFSPRVISALAKERHYYSYDKTHFEIDNLSDLLGCSVSQILRIHNMGKVGLNETISLVKKFIDEHEEFETKELMIKQIEKMSDAITELKELINK